MYYFKVKISYKGTNYFGWQTLLIEEKNTVQETIHKVLRRIAKYQDCYVIGASRTDAGVHAQGQIGKLSLPIEITAEKLLMGMNSLLPSDIRILECEQTDREFSPIHHAINKEYHYYFTNNQYENPHLAETVENISSGSMDIGLMQKTADVFLGAHDFYNFSRRSTTVKTTNREVTTCEIKKVESSFLGADIYCIKIEGRGFLKQMVRYIVATLFAVGLNKVSREEIVDYLNNHKDNKLVPKAKAKGLYLIRIDYRT